MDLKDATLMLLAESAAHPALAGAAQSTYDALASGRRHVPYQTLSELLGDASGKGVLRDLRHKYSATAFEAIVFPICREIDRQKPVPPRRRPAGPDPLTDPDWRP